MGLLARVGLFFDRCPALLPALFFLLGVFVAKAPSIFLAIPFCVLSLPKLSKPWYLLMLASVASLAFLYGICTNPCYTGPVSGRALFVPAEITSSKSHFATSYQVRGEIVSIEGEPSLRRIPCKIPLPSSLRPLKAQKYFIQGSLERKEDYFQFTPDPKQLWVGVGAFSLPEYRYAIKEWLAKRISYLYPEARVARFLSALTLGVLDDSLLRYSFGRLGLQHILAISGFHFGLLSLFFYFFLRRLLPERMGLVLLFIVLSTYFFLVGPSPSVLRAYLAVSLYLLGKFAMWRTTSLNLFGVVLLLELILAPHHVTHLGFQLSFLATGSILLFFPLTHSWMEKVVPWRSGQEALLLRHLDRYFYLFCSFLRSTFALNLAVHLTVIPVCLTCFGSFPLVSLLYNLFVPLFVSWCMFCFFLSLMCPFVSYLCSWLTSLVLDLIVESPNCLSFPLSFPLSLGGLLFVLVGLFFLPFLEKGDFKRGRGRLWSSSKKRCS